MKRFRHASYIFLLVLGCISIVALVSCSSKEKRSLDIRAGLATDTLKEFARQAEVEIIFDMQSVYGVHTNAVSGDFDPRSALSIMLQGTPLKVDYDSESGAFAVIRIELSSLMDASRFEDAIVVMNLPDCGF